ncbi:helix-turn-helix domain-containing protein [Acutalibacter muris]|uniref:winged helix-turn-helix domain-containing protein n=1 Tax=Acutalibacter muris TaxID=1796620 RepID=UPI001F1DEBDB|nr:helix-turn-helix domain-containing protein [Acutalibacter muris]
MTFETIAYHVWGEEYIDVTPKTIHNLLSRLRQKLQIAPEAPEYVISVRGIGYKFDAGI